MLQRLAARQQPQSMQHNRPSRAASNGESWPVRYCRRCWPRLCSLTSGIRAGDSKHCRAQVATHTSSWPCTQAPSGSMPMEELSRKLLKKAQVLGTNAARKALKQAATRRVRSRGAHALSSLAKSTLALLHACILRWWCRPCKAPPLVAAAF